MVRVERTEQSAPVSRANGAMESAVKCESTAHCSNKPAARRAHVYARFHTAGRICG